MRSRVVCSLTVALAAMNVPAIVSATVLYTTPGSIITENFDGPEGPAETLGWTDDTTVPNWFAYQGGGSNATPLPAGPVSQVRKTDGSSTGIVLYLWRLNPSATDYALGTKPLDNNGDVMIALRIQNNTGETLTQFTLGYTGEQWYGTSGGNNNIVPAYQIGSPATLADGTWTQIPGMTFNSPKEGVSPSDSLDGNLGENRQVFAPQAVTDISWAPGEYLYIRWFDNNSGGADQGLAVDDLTFSAAVPEPASLALVGVAGLVAFGRKRDRA